MRTGSGGAAGFTHHPLVPLLLQAGTAAWTQHARSVNNDLTVIHEQALLDAAADLVFLREHGFSSIVTLAEDLTTATVRGLHFGGPIAEGEPAGNELAAAEITDWLTKRHELTPPA